MAGKTRFCSSLASQGELASPEDLTSLNGQRGNAMKGNLNRSAASFDKGNDGQMLSGADMSQENFISARDTDFLSQLDPITMGDQKYTGSGELKRVLETSFGAPPNNCATGAINLKSPLPVATEELKQFKTFIQAASARARYRSKRLGESLQKLNKCWEAVNSTKPLQNELLPNERMRGSLVSKIGSQTPQSPTEFANQRLEDRPKNVIRNKRIRTSAAEIQAKGQSNNFGRQPLAIEKDRDNIRCSGSFSDVVEEKIRRLPASGETLDRKMKRKHSMGTVFARSIDVEEELKRDMYLKPANESGLQSSVSQGLSKSRRPPLKKSRNSKAITRLGHPTSNSPDVAGESDHDSEELLAAANFASNASYIGCSSSFWKKMEPNFAPASLEDIADLKQLVKTIELDQRCLSQMLCLGSDAQDGVVPNDNILSQSSCERSIFSHLDSKEMSSMVDMVDQRSDGSFLCRQMDSEGNKVAPLYQRVLAALIIDDQTDEEIVGDGTISMYKISRSSSLNHHFEQMSVEDKLLLELQGVGLYPEPVPELTDRDCEAIDQDIIQLQKGLFQQLSKESEYFTKLIPSVEESREMEQRAVEQVAMDKLVELAYKKKLATRRRSAARHGLSEVSRPVALAFMKRTLARCRKFEETGKSCFLRPVLKNALFATPTNDNYADSAVAESSPLARNSQQEYVPSGSFPCRGENLLGNPDRPSNLDFGRTQPKPNRGKKKKVLLDDVGTSAPSRPASTLDHSFMGGVKGKMSERERVKDTSGRNFVTKGSHSFAGNTRREHKTKAGAKPKASQLLTSVNGPQSKLMENTSELSVETEEPLNFKSLEEIDPPELGVASELNGHQDLDFWSNIDDDGLQDDAVGLDIPMDDLSEVLI